MSTLETIKTLNATARTCIAALVVGGLGIVGYQGYELYQAPQLELQRTQSALTDAKEELGRAKQDLEDSQRQVVQLEEDNAAQAAQIQRLETSIGLLKVNTRLAELKVLKQEESDGKLVSTISFVETNEEGHPIGEASVFEIEGDMVYVEYLVAKFDDKYVEAADLDRATAICLFHRIFGENQEPNEGFALDQVGTRPTAYARGGVISEFEQKIWRDFWTIANDVSRANELGIRAAHGSANSMRVRPGKRYQIRLRSTGEFTISPIDDA